MFFMYYFFSAIEIKKKSHASREDVQFLREVTPEGLEVILVHSFEKNASTQINRLKTSLGIFNNLSFN